MNLIRLAWTSGYHNGLQVLGLSCHAFMYIYIQTQVYIHTLTKENTWHMPGAVIQPLQPHTGMYIYMHIVYKCTFIHAYICKCTYMYIHTCTSVYKYWHTYTCTCINIWMHVFTFCCIKILSPLCTIPFFTYNEVEEAEYVECGDTFLGSCCN